VWARLGAKLRTEHGNDVARRCLELIDMIARLGGLAVPAAVAAALIVERPDYAALEDKRRQLARQEREAKREAKRAKQARARRIQLVRVKDPDPRQRDVWMTFFPTTDPRLDFMEPVRVCQMR
jgi:hypothetical protein